MLDCYGQQDFSFLESGKVLVQTNNAAIVGATHIKQDRLIV